MKVKDLYRNTRIDRSNYFLVDRTITIHGVPSQEIFKKGSLTLFLTAAIDIFSTAWHENKLSIEINCELDRDVLTFLFNTVSNSEEKFVNIKYMDLTAKLKKSLKKSLQKTEADIKKRHSLFGNRFDKDTWYKKVLYSNGLYQLWCSDEGWDLSDPTTFDKCISYSQLHHDRTVMKSAMLYRAMQWF